VIAERRFDVSELGMTYFLRTFKDGKFSLSLGRLSVLSRLGELIASGLPVTRSQLRHKKLT
jgi:hypothetical protein